MYRRGVQALYIRGPQNQLFTLYAIVYYITVFVQQCISVLMSWYVSVFLSILVYQYVIVVGAVSIRGPWNSRFTRIMHACSWVTADSPVQLLEKRPQPGSTVHFVKILNQDYEAGEEEEKGAILWRYLDVLHKRMLKFKKVDIHHDAFLDMRVSLAPTHVSPSVRRLVLRTFGFPFCQRLWSP